MVVVVVSHWRWFVGRLVVGLVVIVMKCRPGVTIASFAVHGLGMVASAQVLVEDGALGAVEGVLLTISVTKVVNLEKRSL